MVTLFLQDMIIMLLLIIQVRLITQRDHLQGFRHLIQVLLQLDQCNLLDYFWRMNRNSIVVDLKNKLLDERWFPLPNTLDLLWWTVQSYCHNIVFRSIASLILHRAAYWRIDIYFGIIISFTLLVWYSPHRYYFFRKGDNQLLAIQVLYSINLVKRNSDDQRYGRWVYRHLEFLCYHQSESGM